MALTKLSIDRSNNPQTKWPMLDHVNATLRKIRKCFAYKQTYRQISLGDGSVAGDASGKAGGTDKKSTPLKHDPSASMGANGGDAIIKKGGPSCIRTIQRILNKACHWHC